MGGTILYSVFLRKVFDNIGLIWELGFSCQSAAHGKTKYTFDLEVLEDPK